VTAFAVIRRVTRPTRAVLALCALVSAPVPGFAQTPGTKPRVHLREVRIDSLLLVFGADSSRIRSAILEALEKAGRLTPTPGAEVPSVDIDVTALRTAYGGPLEPRGFVRVEVGRNLMEQGTAQRLLWTGTQDLTPSPTFRDLGRSTLPTVLKVVNDYLSGRASGA
jgi:hypothetical protein